MKTSFEIQKDIEKILAEHHYKKMSASTKIKLTDLRNIKYFIDSGMDESFFIAQKKTIEFELDTLLERFDKWKANNISLIRGKSDQEINSLYNSTFEIPKKKHQLSNLIYILN